MHAPRPTSRNPAVRAEPRGIGTAGARDPLAREVKLLGALLGQVIVEQQGEAFLGLVERVRRATIDQRRTGSEAARRAVARELDAIDLPSAEGLIRAFSLYFLLTNLAEEKERVRRLRRRGRTQAPASTEGTISAAVRALRRTGASAGRLNAMMGALSIELVLTAHPTEARRRTTLVALRRCYRLLEQLDDPRLTQAEDADVRRHLREEITLLWHTSALRVEAPSPLDEVRSVMAFFDESLFVIAPRLCREMDLALDEEVADGQRPVDDWDAPAAGDTGRSGTRPPRTGPFLRWGSWVGGDRDGNPNVTAATTREAMRIQSDHVLRGYEAVARRLMQTVAAIVPEADTDAALAARLADDATRMPVVMADLARRFPMEPYRRRFGAIAERLRRTRMRLVDGRSTHELALDGAYIGPGELLAEIDELQAALVGDRLDRSAWGDVQDLAWQVQTFGFHALDLEVRQHSEVHAATLAALDAAAAVAAGADTGPGAEPEEGEAAHAAALATEVSDRVTVGEVLATFRAIAGLQAEFGAEASHRYVISFTRGAQDVLDVLELAGRVGRPAPVLDVVPLFESADALETAGSIVEQLLAEPRYRRHLAARGDRQEVMLGYSDSTKESGTLAASWMLYRAQASLAEVAVRSGVELTIFHGRGGAIGRGGGPMSKAILSHAPGSMRGRLKLTEQGEVIAARYANPQIALRHLERLANAVLLASSPAHEETVRAASVAGAPVMDELAATSRAAFRGTVWEDPGFEAFFRAATPIEELAGLTIGSRPAARARSGDRPRVTMATLRAIPWVFSWSQSRLNLPGWYGVGSALEGYEAAHGAAGLERLRALYREWSFFGTVLDTVELSLAKAAVDVAERYAGLATGAESAAIWARLRAEFDRTRTTVLRIMGRAELLDASPELQRSIALRNPYVDSLSEVQVRLLAALRELPRGDATRAEMERLVHLSVSGVAAGIRNTG